MNLVSLCFKKRKLTILNSMLSIRICASLSQSAESFLKYSDFPDHTNRRCIITMLLIHDHLFIAKANKYNILMHN